MPVGFVDPTSSGRPQAAVEAEARCIAFGRVDPTPVSELLRHALTARKSCLQTVSLGLVLCTIMAALPILTRQMPAPGNPELVCSFPHHRLGLS